MSKAGIVFKALWNRLTMNEQVTAKIVYSIKRQYPKVQRNESCPCGSGEKFKNCCQGRKRISRAKLSRWKGVASELNSSQ